MVSAAIVINKSLGTVWGRIEEEFCKTFQCKTQDLSGRQVTIQTRNYVGDLIGVTQLVKAYTPQESITIESHNGADVVTSSYTAVALDAGTTRVSLSVEGANTQSLLRTWNYKLMSWPVLRGGTKKRLHLQLARLKSTIEGGGDV